jgi:hypothetical protein
MIMNGSELYLGAANALYTIAVVVAVTIVLAIPLIKQFKYRQQKFGYRKAALCLIIINLVIGVLSLIYVIYNLRQWLNLAGMTFPRIDALLLTLGFPIFSFLYYFRFEKHKKVNIALLVFNIILLIGNLLAIIIYLAVRKYTSSI